MRKLDLARIATLFLMGGLWLLSWNMLSAGTDNEVTPAFPPELEIYQDQHLTSIFAMLQHRVQQVPFNAVASLIFLCAILHTFLASKFMKISHRWQHLYEKMEKHGKKPSSWLYFRAEVMHFFGEVEAVFGIWVLVLVLAIISFYDWPTARLYVTQRNYTEPLFVVIIMALASTRPIMQLAEGFLSRIARLGGSTPAVWWLTILTLGPLLGSLITEPAAMTISALLLSKQFYDLQPSRKLAYATLGLLFVNISVGGVMTHFAAPPVLMVAAPWGWDTLFMLQHFGAQAFFGILIANFCYFLYFRQELQSLTKAHPHPLKASSNERPPVPVWIVSVHVLFMIWTVWQAHYPVLFVGGFLFFLGFLAATEAFQDRLDLRGPLLVGFFLAGLVNHGGLQAWWIAPIVGSLPETPLMIGTTILTAFNDNAAITYLSTLIPNFSDSLKHAVMAGAVTGGGLTVIANAPNPAGQAILGKYFEQSISPLYLFLGAAFPTFILGLTFTLWK